MLCDQNTDRSMSLVTVVCIALCSSCWPESSLLHLLHHHLSESEKAAGSWYRPDSDTRHAGSIQDLLKMLYFNIFIGFPKNTIMINEIRHD